MPPNKALELTGASRRQLTAKPSISQYNLAITVPNERFEAVKKAAAGEAAP